MRKGAGSPSWLRLLGSCAALATRGAKFPSRSQGSSLASSSGVNMGWPCSAGDAAISGALALTYDSGRVSIAAQSPLAAPRPVLGEASAGAPERVASASAGGALSAALGDGPAGGAGGDLAGGSGGVVLAGGVRSAALGGVTGAGTGPAGSAAAAAAGSGAGCGTLRSGEPRASTPLCVCASRAANPASAVGGVRSCAPPPRTC